MTDVNAGLPDVDFSLCPEFKDKDTNYIPKKLRIQSKQSTFKVDFGKRRKATNLMQSVKSFFILKVFGESVDTFFVFCRILGFQFCDIHELPSY